MNSTKSGFSTRAVHAGEEPKLSESNSGDVVSPIHLSTTFARKIIEKPTGGFEYTRSSNPTRKALEVKLAALEEANYGLAFASGLAAEIAVFMALLKSGDHIIAGNDLYGGTVRVINKILSEYGIECSYIDMVTAKNFDKYIKDNTRMVWIETPTNPLLNIIDIARVSKLCKKYNLKLVVDNTFLSPYFQLPLNLGADITLHSITKYIGGHSDVLGGCIMMNDEALYKKIKFYQNAAGNVPSPFDCYNTMRGIKTLALRMEKHQENALKLAHWLEGQSIVSRVIYPGLPSHPQHELIKKQAGGFGGRIAFELNTDIKGIRNFFSNLQLISLAESLGGVESLIGYPVIMSHGSLTPEARKEAGITDNLIRFSVGIENAEDIIEDLHSAFACLPERD
jgi:cystathionine gamma-lyase